MLHTVIASWMLEYKDGKVAQCRGLRNCGMPPEVKAFVNVFEKKMQNAAQKGGMI